jgi:hypothetical protein
MTTSTLTLCQERGYHSFRPDNADVWACLDCKVVADRDPALPCDRLPLYVAGGGHKWIGYDASGLLCEAEQPYNRAKRVHCSCGASQAWGRVPEAEPDFLARWWKQRYPHGLTVPYNMSPEAAYRKGLRDAAAFLQAQAQEMARLADKGRQK